MKANYGKILKMHEKDNPSPFCRASYLISNVGDMVKCYGRMLRFPDDAHIYQKEMELAIGDVIMQCRLIQVENDIEETEPDKELWDSIEGNCITTMYHAATLIDLLERENRSGFKIDGDMKTIETETTLIIDNAASTCKQLGTDFNTIQHLGFIHTIERFKEFERRGWQ